MLFNYLYLFMIGSIFGYFIELFYRKKVMNKWIKPGIFKGVYLPLYGMGLCISYFIYNLEVNALFKVILSILLLTLIELLCGVIFIKCFKIPLWDYSDKLFNYKGLICLKFSIIWGIMGSIFIFGLFPHINFSYVSIPFNFFLMTIFYLILLLDICITFSKLLKTNT